MKKDMLSDQGRQNIIDAQNLIWADPNKRAEHSAVMKSRWAECPQRNAQVSKELKQRWENPQWKEYMTTKQSQGAKARWADPVKRAELLAAQKAAYDKKVALRKNNEND
jgi:hypothetical protein